ncbi:E3 SUMO-protein ligase NSE2-like [Procambarus clarkii]
MDELKQDSDMREIISNAASVKSFREQLLAQIDPKSGYNNNDDDTEVMTTKETVNLIDPISKMIMTDPVRNKHCGHVYERLSVVKMIKASKRKGFRCPSMGCGYREPLKVTDLEDALDVKRQILINKK